MQPRPSDLCRERTELSKVGLRGGRGDGTICFLAAAILFSTLAACFVNKQRKRKLKRKKGGCRLENRETGPCGQSCQRDLP